jgi:hypothetical protein
LLSDEIDRLFTMMMIINEPTHVDLGRLTNQNLAICYVGLQFMPLIFH